MLIVHVSRVGVAPRLTDSLDDDVVSLHEDGEILDLEERLYRPKPVSKSDSNPSSLAALWIC